MLHPVRLHAHWDVRGVMGLRLRSARIEAGISQSELSRRSATTQALISDYERGIKEPTYPMLVRLLSAMDMAADITFRPNTEEDRHDAILEESAIRDGWQQEFETGRVRR